MNIADAATSLAEEASSDVFIYSGEIKRGLDLKFIEAVYNDCLCQGKKRDNAILLLTTRGGSPDAGYKIARYLQDNYTEFRVLVSGMCKSAGTLIAVGATEIVFTPYGELGPIDIQKRKVDSLVENQSGLVTDDTIDSLMDKAIQRHISGFYEILKNTEAAVSFETAAHVSAELVTGMLGRVFEGIHPYEVGENARAMRIAMDYCERLAKRTRNIKDAAIRTLAKSYPSHGFVIDYAEAETLFNNVRYANDAEKKLIQALGPLCRDQIPGHEYIACLSKPKEETGGVKKQTDTSGSASSDEKAPSRAARARRKPAVAKAKSNGTRRKTSSSRKPAK